MGITLPAIRTIEEARDALAEVLEAAARPGQIIGMMEKIMFCRSAETRRFLSDALDGLIKGGLEEMREKRRKALEQKQAEDAARAKVLEAQIQETSAERREEAIDSAAEGADDSDAPIPIVIVPPAEEIKVLEELGTQLDALNLAAVAREIFPDLKTKAQPWEVGRAIYLHEKEARDFLLQGARLKDHERATMLAPAWDAMQRLIENSKPDWTRHAPEVRSLIDEYFAANPPVNGGADANIMFEVLLMRDDHVRELLVMLGADRPAALETIGALRSKLDQLLEFEAGRKE